MAEDIKNGEDHDITSSSKDIGGPPADATPSQIPAIENDIAAILKDVPLPERRSEGVPGLRKEKPEPQMAPTPEPLTPQQPEKNPVAPIHTLKHDLQSVVQDQKVSLVRAVALEEDKRALRDQMAGSQMAQESNRRRTTGLIVLMSGLILTGLVALAAVFLVMEQRAGSKGEPIASQSLIFSEQTIPFLIGTQSSDELKRQLAGARETTALTLGAMTHLRPIIQSTDPQTQSIYEREATTAEFLTALGAHAPDELIRALGDTFFFGMHTVDEQAPLLVIEVKSYERAFAGMLEWEQSLNGDLVPVFTGVSRLVDTGILTERRFEDDIMRNFDVRVLKDDSGVIQLYYAFPTRTILIIAESPYSFSELLSRLRAERRL